jgi:hypothetical protein
MEKVFTRTFGAFVVRLLCLVMFLLGLTTFASEQKKQMQPNPMSKSPMMTAGMRRMTMAERRKAATRNTQRKLAAGHKNAAVQHNRHEVKQ